MWIIVDGEGIICTWPPYVYKEEAGGESMEHRGTTMDENDRVSLGIQPPLVATNSTNAVVLYLYLSM